jgi:hypothetical protein
MVRQNSLIFLRGTRAATAPEILVRLPADCNTAAPQHCKTITTRYEKSLGAGEKNCKEFSRKGLSNQSSFFPFLLQFTPGVAVLFHAVIGTFFAK